MLFTLNSSVFSERMPFAEASAAARLVAWEIFLGDGGGADQDLVGAGFVGGRYVDDEMNFTVFHNKT